LKEFNVKARQANTIIKYQNDKLKSPNTTSLQTLDEKNKAVKFKTNKHEHIKKNLINQIVIKEIEGENETYLSKALCRN
jgi:hypothetical protein